MKKLTIIFLAVFISFSLCACDNNGTISTPAGEQVTLRIAWWGSDVRHEYTKQMLDKYTELNPNVHFVAIPSEFNGYYDRLASSAATGDLPDIIQMSRPHISTYAQKNQIANLDPYIESGVIDLSDVNKDIIDIGRVDDKVVAVALSITALAFFYNPDVLAEAGLEPPSPEWTWDDFEKMCQTVKQKTGKWGFSSDLRDLDLFGYQLRQHGESLYTPDLKSVGYKSDDRFLDFLALYKRMIDTGATPAPDEFEAIRALDKESVPILTGDAAFCEEWGNFAVISERANSKIEIINPPNQPNGEDALWLKEGMFFSISEKSNYKEEAAQFINWFINSKEANDIALAERGVPVSATIREYLSPTLSPSQQDMFQYIDYITEHSAPEPVSNPLAGAVVGTALEELMMKAIFNEITPEVAATEFRKTVAMHYRK
jgi:multiple sugar transport system substrate-binding protein